MSKGDDFREIRRQMATLLNDLRQEEVEIRNEVEKTKEVLEEDGDNQVPAGTIVH